MLLQLNRAIEDHRLVNGTVESAAHQVATAAVIVIPTDVGGIRDAIKSDRRMSGRISRALSAQSIVKVKDSLVRLDNQRGKDPLVSGD